ncbi:MAG TPA: polysaccharide deacetylase family protein [Methylomirabilota bacterium]|nr:polysaccharide deacetylase family protein [Methylomirabilota bacterium]
MNGSRRSEVIRWVASAVYHARLIRLLELAARYGRGRSAFQVLTYHRVNDDEDPFFPAVPTRIFEQHMSYIARAYRVLTVEDLVDRIGRGDVPPGAVAITFDDGYRDTLTHAAPILARLGVPATIFLATGFIGTGEIPWVDRLALALKRTKDSSVVSPWGEAFSLAGSSERLRVLDLMLRHLKRLPDNACRAAVEALCERLDVPDEAARPVSMLSWDDVRTLARLGFSIGAHTVSHPILSQIESGRAWAEIAGSRDAIAAACGRAPRAFAYPNGGTQDYTPAVVDLVRRAGFTCAATTRFGVNGRHTNPWELRRGGPWEHHLPTFAAKLAWYRIAAVCPEDPLVKTLPTVRATGSASPALPVEPSVPGRGTRQ